MAVRRAVRKPAKTPKVRPTAITSLQETSSKGKWNWLVYGDSGIGKSWLAATCPNALALVSEVGAMEGAKEFGFNPDIWVTEKVSEIDDAYQYLASGGHQKYDWVVMDSVTENEELIWRDELDMSYQLNPRRSLYNPALQDYPTVWNRTKELVNRFNRLPVNVLYTATAMRIEAEDEETDETISKLLPMLGSVKRGDLSQKVCAKATLVGLLRVGKSKGEGGEPIRRLHLTGTKRWIAKSRHPSLGRVVENPNISEMVATINGKPKRKRSA